MTGVGAPGLAAAAPPHATAAPVARAASTDRAGVALMVAGIVLLALNGVDAVIGIVPQGDDFTLSLMAPGAIRAWYGSTYGWIARPLGMALTDAVNVLQHAFGGHLVAVLLVVRAGALATFLVSAWSLFGLPVGAALAGTIVFALTPTAFEAWTQMTNVHNHVAAPFAIAVCGLYTRTLTRASATRGVDPRGLALAAVVQVAVYATYEQALLAIPAFVAALLAGGIATRRLTVRSALTVGGVAVGLAAVWGAALLASGYVRARGVTLPSREAGGVELRDALSALQRLWIGMVQHHVWRAVELVRTGRVWWWDSTVSGVVAAGAAAATAVLAARVTRGLASEPAQRAGDAWRPRPALLALGAAVAAWAAMVPVGFAVRGFPLVSRMYYLPAAFVALGIASVLPAAARRAPRALPVVAGAFALWSALLLRRYMDESRAGTRLTLEVAREAAAVPARRAALGILVVAPDVYGTWNSGAVQAWSLRPAAKLTWHRDPAGPMLFAATCREASEPRVRDEQSHVVPAPQWGAVVAVRNGTVMTAESLAQACP